MRGEILLKALEILKECALSQADFLEAVLAAGYGASMGKIDYEYSKAKRRRERASWERKNLEKRRKRLQNFLYQMKHDGLIETTKKQKVAISQKGEQKLGELKRRPPGRDYPKIDTNRMTIISFDIPEKFHGKRDWFREVVRNLGFRMIHQSVWMGKKGIPESLVNDLENLKILEHIEIFEVTKSGSLKKVV